MNTQQFPRNARSLGFALMGLIASSHFCPAADYQWDVNSAADGLGNTGTWNLTNTFWDDLSAGVNDGTDTTQAVTFSASHNATFAGTAGTVTMQTVAQTLGTLTFSTPDYILTGATGNLTYKFEGLTTLSTSGTTTFNQGANNNRFVFNGGINLNGSAISISLRNTLNGATASNAIGKVTGNGTLNVTNELSGVNNTARFILWNATNDYTGSTVVDGAILDINSVTALGTSTLTLNSTVAGITTVIRNSSAAALTLTNNNAMAWNGDFTFNAGSARAGTGSGIANLRDLNMGTGPVTLGGNRIITVFANTLTIGGVIGDGENAYSLTKAGAGRLNLDGINTYVFPDVNDGTNISYTLPTGLGKIFARLVVTQIP